MEELMLALERFSPDDSVVSSDISLPFIDTLAANQKMSTENAAPVWFQEFVKNSFTPLANNVVALKTDVEGLKKDMITLKTDVADIKRDVSIIKREVRALRAETRAIRDMFGNR
jgi:hypothetical protein